MRAEDRLEIRPLGVHETQDPAVVEQVAEMLQELVRNGAALGWVEPPTAAEVATLLQGLAMEGAAGDAWLLCAWIGSELVGTGYWKRYERPTHRVHADIEKIAVHSRHQGLGIGRRMMVSLIASAAASGIEVLTLDFRGDNERAADLYRSLGFREYGRLARFVAVGSARYDKVLCALDLRDAEADRGLR